MILQFVRNGQSSPKDVKEERFVKNVEHRGNGGTSFCIVRRSEMEECLLYTVVTCSLFKQICIDCFR